MQRVRRFVLIAAAVLVVALPTAASGQTAAPAGRDLAEAAGLGTGRVLTHGETAVRDFDADGDRDIVLSFHASAPSELWERVDGQERYRRVANIPFGRPDRHSCAWGNVNSDDRPDLYCSLGGGRGQTTGKSNELWIQQPDGSFSDQAEDLGVADPFGRGRDVAFFDADNDGDGDLFVGNREREDDPPAPNQFFVNDGGRFRSAAEYGLNVEAGGDCVVVWDYDRDGFRDLFTCGSGQTRDKPSRLYRNEGGERFRDVTAEVGLDGVEAQDAQFVNLDGAGRPELVLVSEDALEVRHWGGTDYREVVWRQAVPAGRNLAVGDALGSGLADVYVLQGGERCDGDNPDGETQPDPYTPATCPDDFLLENTSSAGDYDFVRRAVPQERTGSGDTVTAITDFRDGRDAFLVNNGYRRVPGRRQLVVFP